MQLSRDIAYITNNYPLLCLYRFYAIRLAGVITCLAFVGNILEKNCNMRGCVSVCVRHRPYYQGL